MKRWYLSIVAVGALAAGAARAQEGLAPTVPVVPAPVLQNGNVQAPSGGSWGAGGRRFFSASKWSPFRNPAMASVVEPIAPASPYLAPLPPLPNGVSRPSAPNGVHQLSGEIPPGAPGAPAVSGPGECGAAGCSGHDRSCWARCKDWLCYHYSPTDAPKCQPHPYVTPIQGMIPCGSPASCGACGGCGSGGGPVSTLGYPVVTGPPYGLPAGPPPGALLPPPGPPMPQQLPPPGTAGPVVMPPRGTQGMLSQPTWQGRVVPESAVGSRTAPGTIVPTGYKYPSQAPVSVPAPR
jgi:hypothetical protein